MLKMVDGTGIIGVDMVCPLGGAVSPPQPPNYDNVEMEGVGSLTLPNSLIAPLERVELIGNSTQGENPAPDNPQEIKSAGRKSKNLFNISDLKNGLVQSDGTIKAVGVYKSIVLNIKEDGKYFITFKKNDEYDVLYFTTLYSSEIFSNPYINIYPDVKGTILLKKGRNILSFKAKKNGAECPFINDYEIMIAAESETTDYEPYGYLFDVKVTGKNLLNLQKEPDVKGVYQGWKVGDGEKTIVLSIKDKGNNVDITKCSIGVSGNGINSNDGLGWIVQDGVIKRSEIKTINPYVSIYPSNETSVQKFLERFDIQAEYGEIATPYEPYTEQTVQIALDEPLRGIGEYKDVLTKDGVVRRILEAPLVKYLKPVINGNVGDRYVFAEVPNANINYDRKRCMSNVGFTNNAEKKKYVPHPYQFNFLIRIADDDTIEMVKEKIKDIIVTYTAKEPITEPLPESVQQQLQALHSENGTTHVFVDSGEVPCGIKLTYRKEK